MSTFPFHFADLLSDLEPPEARAKDAKELPAQVRQFLKDCDEVVTVVPHSRLAGSYARHTANKLIKDVDIILLIDSTYQEKEASVVLNALAKALKNLPEALEDEGAVVALRHQRRSVNVELKHREFNLDIVPAIATDGLDNPLVIPDRDWNEWIKTHPLGYGSALSTLNQAHGNKVVRLMKLFKHWRDIQMTYRRPKSYWLESIIYHLFHNGTLTSDNKSYAELYQDLLAATLQWFNPEREKEMVVPDIPDPILAHNVAHNWERGGFDQFMACVEESLGWVKRALDQADTDEGKAKAIVLWQKVFGDAWFPTESKSERNLWIEEAIRHNNIYVTGNGRVYPELPAIPSIQPPRQRFYGG